MWQHCYGTKCGGAAGALLVHADGIYDEMRGGGQLGCQLHESTKYWGLCHALRCKHHCHLF